MVKEKKETKTAEQKTLFGDHDLVHNVLQTRHSDLNAEIRRCEDIIEKKNEAIQQLSKDVAETEKAITIVRKQMKAAEGKGEDKAGGLPSSKDPASKEAPF